MSKVEHHAQTVAMFKVFTKGEDGRWRIESFHPTRQAADQVAAYLINRTVVARVML